MLARRWFDVGSPGAGLTQWLARVNLRSVEITSAAGALVMLLALGLDAFHPGGGGREAAVSWQGTQAALLGGLLLGLRLIPRLRSHAVALFTLTWGISAIALGRAVASGGGFDGPLLYAVLLAPAVSSVLLVPPGPRVALALLFPGLILLSLGLERPDLLGDPRLPTTASLVLASVAGSVTLGHVAYALLRDNALKRVELARQRETLAGLARSQREFFEHVSHELRTPLSLVGGAIQRLTMEGPDDRVADAGLRNVARLEVLVDELLELARMETEVASEAPVVADLAEHARDLLARFQPVLGAGSRLELDAPDEPVPARVDARTFPWVLANLVSNALRHGGEGGVRVTVAVRAEGAARVLEVADDGPGMDEQARRLVFDRFRQLDPGGGRGTGIGLALVARVVEAHRGTIELASEPGRGSRFRVRLPAGDVEAGPPGRLEMLRADQVVRSAPPAAGPEPPVAHDRGPRPRILIVEDDPDMRDFLAGDLGAQWNVAVARDAREALARVEEALPDLVLTDVMMPEVNGLELVRRLRGDARTARVPVVVLTARGGPDDRADALRAGADDCLTKPFGQRELRARVGAQLARAEYALRQARLNEELEARVEEQTAELRALARHLDRAAEAERQRIARDLHDELGQALTAMRHGLYRLRRVVDDEEGRQRAEALQDLLDDIHGTVRNLGDEMRPLPETVPELSAAVQGLLDRVEEQFGLATDLRLDVEDRPARPDAVQALYRVAQEAVTNAVRHAQGASLVQVTLRDEGAELVLAVADDGVGLRPAEGPARGVGLVGMRERVRAAGGRLSVEDAAPGVRVAAAVPRSGQSEEP